MTRNKMTNKQYNIENKLGYRPGVDVGNECPRVSRSRMNQKRRLYFSPRAVFISETQAASLYAVLRFF